MRIRYLQIGLAFMALFGLSEEASVRFKTRTYQPTESLDRRVYRVTPYTSRRGSPAMKALEPRSTRGFWARFRSRKPEAAADRLEEVSRAPSRRYAQERKIRVPTIQAPPGTATENRAFVPAVKQRQDAAFKAKKASGEKNPLLRPRQGIKEPE